MFNFDHIYKLVGFTPFYISNLEQNNISKKTSPNPRVEKIKRALNCESYKFKKHQPGKYFDYYC